MAEAGMSVDGKFRRGTVFGCQSLEFSHESSDLVGRREEAKER